MNKEIFPEQCGITPRDTQETLNKLRKSNPEVAKILEKNLPSKKEKGEFQKRFERGEFPDAGRGIEASLPNADKED